MIIKQLLLGILLSVFIFGCRNKVEPFKSNLGFNKWFTCKNSIELGMDINSILSNFEHVNEKYLDYPCDCSEYFMLNKVLYIENDTVIAPLVILHFNENEKLTMFEINLKNTIDTINVYKIKKYLEKMNFEFKDLKKNMIGGVLIVNNGLEPSVMKIQISSNISSGHGENLFVMNSNNKEFHVLKEGDSFIKIAMSIGSIQTVLE